MRVQGTTLFPPNMAFAAANDLDATRYEGLTAAREARALGVHWILAPVADVNNNPENPVINIRSYGEDPDQVIRHVTAFIEGAHSDPKHRVLVTVKHFPGHGDTDINSHLGLPHLGATRERIEAVELKPFRAAITMGVDAIMTEHMAVPALEPEDIPATVSPKVVADLLRTELKFPNLIVTDAMNMEGLTKQFSDGDAAVRALAAGSDVLLIPPDPERAIRAVMDAVKIGRIPRRQIDESAVRVLAAKVRLGLLDKKLVDLDAVSDVLESPEAAERAQQISDHAVTLVRNEGGLLPLAPGSRGCLIIAREVQVSPTGQRMMTEFRRRAPMGRTILLDPTFPLAALEAAVGDTAPCSALVVVSSMSPSQSRENFTMAGEFAPLVKKLTEGPVPVVLVSLGDPYLLAAFPMSAAYIATFSATVPSEVSAVKALFGEMPITGHMPVTIPGFAKVGEGIQLAARGQ